MKNNDTATVSLSESIGSTFPFEHDLVQIVAATATVLAKGYALGHSYKSV